MSTITRDSDPNTLTIASGQTTSPAYPVFERAFGGFAFPAAMDGTAISFLVSFDSRDTAAGSRTFVPLNRTYDNGSGTQTYVAISLPFSANIGIKFPDELFAASYFQIVSNATETAGRTFMLTSKA